MLSKKTFTNAARTKPAIAAYCVFSANQRQVASVFETLALAKLALPISHTQATTRDWFCVFYAHVALQHVLNIIGLQ